MKRKILKVEKIDYLLLADSCLRNYRLLNQIKLIHKKNFPVRLLGLWSSPFLHYGQLKSKLLANFFFWLLGTYKTNKAYIKTYYREFGLSWEMKSKIKSLFLFDRLKKWVPDGMLGFLLGKLSKTVQSN